MGNHKELNLNANIKGNTNDKRTLQHYKINRKLFFTYKIIYLNRPIIIKDDKIM